MESFPQLKLVFAEYQKIAGVDIEEVLKTDTPQDARDLFLSIRMKMVIENI